MDGSNPEGSIRVFIVDDVRAVIDGIRHTLGDRFEVVGDATTVADGVAGILEAMPRVAMVDVRLGGGASGAAVIRAVRSQVGDAVTFLAISQNSEWGDVRPMFEAGAIGYALKTEPTFARAVELVAARIPFLSQELSAMLKVHVPADRFVADEHAVIERMAAGMSSEEVASALDRPVEEIFEIYRAVIDRLTGDTEEAP